MKVTDTQNLPGTKLDPSGVAGKSGTGVKESGETDAVSPVAVPSDVYHGAGNDLPRLEAGSVRVTAATELSELVALVDQLPDGPTLDALATNVANGSHTVDHDTLADRLLADRDVANALTTNDGE